MKTGGLNVNFIKTILDFVLTAIHSTMNGKLLLLGLLYCVQGIPYGMQSSLLPIYFRTSGLSFTKISLTKILYFPWILKVIWAPLVDQFSTKRQWLLFTMCGMALCCLITGTLSPEYNFSALAVSLLLMNLMASVQDIAVDGVAVQILQSDEVGYGNTVQVVGYKLGSVFAGGGLLTIMNLVGWGLMFALLSIVYVIVILYTAVASELKTLSKIQSNRHKSMKHSLNPWRILQEILRVPDTFWTIGFVLVYKLGEQGAISMFPLFLLDHGMSAGEIGLWHGMVAMVFSIIGSSLGGFLTTRYKVYSLMKIFFILRLLSLAFQTFLINVFNSNSWLMKGCAILSINIQHFFGGSITTLAFSIMMQCTKMAHVRIQATHYSFLATLEVLGKLSFSILVGWIVDWVGFFLSFIIFQLLSVVAILHVYKAPKTLS
ncbi:major facilitator superfamily domain-containing protein 3 isoform X1 [Polypterus senegalus]|uniref:major facilitator superfamily domain-containing protein 3 isoform X1 n=2 Tax=Polypterus senegalus TaxID=55291 RepID=UPI001962D89E|nr:major facilitator superfamily domain-containing protein 3 isoform X1 [Polypterus senegalus]